MRTLNSPSSATLLIASFNRVPNVMTVAKDVTAKNVAEFIEYVKANPGKVNMASSGNGTSVHLSGEMFMAMTGTKMQHVPYRGAAPAITDMLGGVRVIFDNMPSIIQHVRSGALRALAVTGPRSDRRNYPTCRRWPKPFPAMRRVRCSGWARQKTRRRKIITKPQQRNQCGAGRARHEEAAGRTRRAIWLIETPEAFGDQDQGRNREVEEGSRVRRPQGGMGARPGTLSRASPLCLSK